MHVCKSCWMKASAERISVNTDKKKPEYKGVTVINEADITSVKMGGGGGGSRHLKTQINNNKKINHYLG